MAHSLDRYREMRDFSVTPEPRGRAARGRRAVAADPMFVVQKHQASRLHYDLRLQIGDVLASWAVPKGPSLRVGERRLAMHTEDHPLEYADFEGDIPEGQYGAGHMEVWDRGTWVPLVDPDEGLASGRLEFELRGRRLRGRFALVRMKPPNGDKREHWLLIRARDADADSAVSRRQPRREAVQRRVSTRRGNADERIEVAGVPISNAQRPIPGEALTKLDLVRYYEAVADTMLPDVAQRPLSLVRCPGGNFAHCFFRRHAEGGAPGGEDASGIPFVRVRNLRELIASVQGGTIEFHSWGSSAPRIDRPDRITLDLDPDAAMPWSTFREACNLTRELLDRLELAWFVKTTGGKGLHFVIPIARRHGWDEVKDLARRIAERLVASAPTVFIANMSKAKRKDRVFVDYLRNAAGASAIASYSVRARKGLPVSMPIAWEALAEDVRGDYFNVRNVPKLLAERGTDPWAEYPQTRQTIARALEALSRG